MTDVPRRDRVRPPAIIWWLLGALGVVMLAALIFGIKHYDEDLTDRAQAALREAGIPVEVHFDGRHGYVTGTLEYEEDVVGAVAVVRDVRGVANVQSEITYLIAGSRERVEPPPSAAPTTSPELTFAVEDGIILLRGRVPTQDALDAILAAAEAEFGADNVLNELQVSDGLESPDWVGRLPAAIEGLSDLPTGTVAFGPEGASVSGTVDAENLKTAIGDVITRVVAPLNVNNRINVVTPVGPSLLAAGDAGIVTLQGEMPDQERIDRIVAAAGDIYGADNVVNEMTVGVAVQSAGWLDVAPGLFVRTVGLDPWEIEIAEGSMSVFGRGPADGTVQGAIDAFGDVGGGLLIDTADLEVSSEAVASELTDLLEGSATFETGSATLSDEATALLDRAIELLLANPSTVLVVEGHTDDQGPEDQNQELSQSRADAVVAYLVAGGVGADRLAAIGYGESQPVAGNDTAEGRAENRRIEFIVEEGTN